MGDVTGHIIGIEGIDAVGKHTHTGLLSSWLKTKQIEAATLTFPDYETHIGREIQAFLSGLRDYPPELRHMLFAANRWEKSKQITEELQHHKTLIVNRYKESNLAYGVANGLDPEWLINLEKGLPDTDLVLVLDAPPETVTLRRQGRKDVYERDMLLQRRVRNAYRELAKQHGWTVVNAVGSIEEVHHEIVKAVERALLLRGRPDK